MSTQWTVWSEEELDRALAALHSEVDSDPDGLDHARALLAIEPPRRHRGRLLAAAAVVVALVAGFLALQAIPFGGNPPASAAATALRSAADNIRTSDPPVGPGQYRYVATHKTGMWGFGTERQVFTFLDESLVEIWVPADPNQEWLLRSTPIGERKWVQGTEAEARAAGAQLDKGGQPYGEWRATCDDIAGNVENNRHCSGLLGDRLPVTSWLAGLPRDPRALHDRLSRSAPSDSRLFGSVADLLHSGRAPADLRAALYRVLAALPGLVITDRQANLDGRTGIAYTLRDRGTQDQIIIDPTTGEYLGERKTATEDLDFAKAGTVLSSSSVTTAVVDAMGAKPPA